MYTYSILTLIASSLFSSKLIIKMVNNMFSVYVKKGDIEGSFKFPWKVSIVAFMANPALMKGKEVKATLEELTSDPFFDVLEINNLPEEAWKEVDEALKDKNIEIALGLQPLVLAQGKNPSSTNEEERKEAVKEIIKWIDFAAKKGIKRVAFCSGPDPGEEKREEAKKALIKSLLEITEYAKKKGVYVILETFDRIWDKKQLIGPITEAVEVAKTIREKHSNFGLLWDLSHGPMLDEKPEDLKIAKDYLAHIHIGCTKLTPEGKKDWHPGFYRPNAVNGINEVKELLKVLREINYIGAIGFEVKPEQTQEWLEVVQAAKGVLYTAYALMIMELL